MKYQFIEKCRDGFPLRLLCRVLGVAVSAYYAWRGRPPSSRARQDAELIPHIREAYEKSGERYGSPRVHRELQSQGLQCSEKRVARLMQEQGLRVCPVRRLVVTTQSNPALPIMANVLDRQFEVSTVVGLDRVWAGDITYIPTAQGWLYLAVVLDLKSRKVIGWGMSESLEQGLVSGALAMALGQRQPEAGLLHHSDRGSQYASRAYQDQLQQQGIVCSMSRKGNCWDNAPVESFFATLKKELVHRQNYRTREEARTSLFHYIEVFYNRHRRHSALGYLSPEEYERQWRQQQLTKAA